MLVAAKNWQNKPTKLQVLQRIGHAAAI